MVMTKVFIDGSAGTTGLRIYERLSDRADLELIKLPEELRKDTNARRDALNKCDVAFLCLPDAAAVEAVELIENDKDETSQFVSMYIKGSLKSPEKSVVEIVNDETNTILNELGFKWSKLGDEYVRKILDFGDVH